MSATRTRASNKRGEVFYTNLIAVTAADFLDSTGTALAVGMGTGVSTAAAFVLNLRDMGTQVTIPGDYTGSTRRVLRKVQLIASGAASAATVAANANEGVSGVATGTTASAQGNVTQPGYGAFYIEVGAVAAANKWASLVLPAL
jgi:hypothetical protein